MKKNYLFLAAASALVLASCSSEADTPKNPVEDNTEDVISLTTLSSTSQASRITKLGTRADNDKKARLKKKFEIAPVETAATEKWSATGVDFTSTGVYVSWHSDRQATTQATKWGGAVDVITGWPNNLTFAETYVSDIAKFNNVVADGNNLFVPLTDAKKGAAIARIELGNAKAPIRKLAGTSANALEIKDGRVYAVSGYSKGGVFSVDKNFTADGKMHVETIVSGDNFGGKYIVGDYVLRTDDEAAYIYDIANKKEYNIGAPLLSETKDAENYDPETGAWNKETGNTGRYYGKHTMAVDGDYIYVAGGQAEKGSQNGLRVIRKSDMTQVGGNATNTTAVCVSGDYVYAATGAGLRVYKKFDGTKLELFAFESIPAVDKNGNAILDKEGNQKYEAGTTAHSCNYVAVKDNYIYMANGQSGVYVFELDTTAPAEEETPTED